MTSNSVRDILQTQGIVSQKMQAFCALALPDEITIPFPDTYEALWNWAVSKKEGIHRLAWGLPRGYAKTTLLKLLIGYLLIHGLRKFPLVVCATEKLAKAFLLDVKMILESDNIRELYGPIIWEQDQADAKIGIWQRTSEKFIIWAIGAGSAVRGVNLAIQRPDLILCDDAQTKENADSPAERATLKSWYFATLLKASDRNKALYLYVGNMYNSHCLLRILQKSAEWLTFITGSILEDGTTLWPEFRSLDAIRASHRADVSVNEEDTFWAEEQNIPRDDIKSGLTLSGVEVQDPSVEKVRVGGFLTVDPAAGKVHSDNVAIAAHLVYEDIPCIVDGSAQNRDPGDTISEIIRLCLKWNIKCVGIESVAYQSTLVYHTQQRLTELSITDVRVVELYPGKVSKNKRIKSWIHGLRDSSYLIASYDVMNLIRWEIGFFDMAKTDNKDDMLDVSAMGNQMVHKYREFWLEDWNSDHSNITDADFITQTTLQEVGTHRMMH